MRGLPFSFRTMKNLLFPNAHRAYAGFESYIPVNVGTSWIAIALVEDAKAKEILELNVGVREISDADFDSIKKKLQEGGTAYRSFQTVTQNPERHPNAQPAEEAQIKDSGSPSPKASPKDLIKREAVDAEVEEIPMPKSKPKSKKGRK